MMIFRNGHNQSQIYIQEDIHGGEVLERVKGAGHSLVTALERGRFEGLKSQKQPFGRRFI
jgi:hypothetical protein